MVFQKQIEVFHKLKLLLILMLMVYYLLKQKKLETGIEQSVTIQGASNLDETEIETMLRC